MTLIHKPRCFANHPSQQIYAHYHDYEWGQPLTCNNKLLEALILEIAQAGLSFETVLLKRPHYRQAYYGFDLEKVASMTDRDLESLCKNRGLIRHKKKIQATRQNARVILSMNNVYGSFSEYLWSQFNHKPIINHWQHQSDVPDQTTESQKLCKDLKQHGMLFIGPTTIYAFMQAVGIVDDHIETCWLRQQDSSKL